MLQGSRGSPSAQIGQQLLTNFYQIQFDPSTQIGRYQFFYEPPLAKPLEDSNQRNIFKTVKTGLNANLKLFLMMNNQVYSHTILPNEPHILGSIEIDGQNYEIQLRLKNIVKPGEPEYNQLIARFFKLMLKKQNLLQIGRKYFDTRDSKKFDQFQLQVLPGLMCNLVRFDDLKTYYVNVDCSFKVLRTQTVYDELRQTKNFGSLEGVTVMTSYNQKFYRINKIDSSIKPTSKFSKQDGTEMSYIDYYRDRYKIDIKDHNQPMIEVIEKSRKNQEEKIINLIPELCQLTGLTNEMRANFQTMKQLSTVTKPRGVDRVRQANKFISCFHNSESQKIMKEWNIMLSQKCMEVESTKLKAGDVVMNNGQKYIPIETSNLDRDTQCEMLKSFKFQTWAVLYTQRDSKLASDFMSTLRESIEYCRYPCAPPKTFEIPSNRINDWINQIQSLVQMAQTAQNINLLLLILPGSKKQAPLYDDLKRFLMNNQPIPSQVILTSTVQGPKGKVKTVCNKLLAQMCAKLGGTPWGISDMPFSNQATMVCGLDVYHSTSRAKNSFLTFVSTDDAYFSRYITQSTDLQSGQEFCSNLQQIMYTAIKAFRNSGQALYQIIVYRDGVSASQSKVVTDNEVVQYRQAIQQIRDEVKEQPEIKLIVITVNKKVGAKFYAGDRNYDNPAQGTLVNQVISTPNDFYLIAQKTHQGTVQPTHYHVLCNDLEGQQDIMRDLQILSYKLCYMYYNFSGAIKIPAPIQYAHICSNFIGDRYDAKKPETLIKPHESFMQRRSLYYI